MHWFRAHLRSSSVVALFALVLSLALSFGHAHLDNLPAPAQIEASGTTAPASGDTPDHADGYCAICAIVHLARVLLPVGPPALALPVAFGRAQFTAAAFVAAPKQTTTFFAARAPAQSARATASSRTGGNRFPMKTSRGRKC